MASRLPGAEHEYDLTVPGAYMRVGVLYHHFGAEIADCAAAGHPQEAGCGAAFNA